jgi:MinD-like ATPase involved in chromosome partitioning or flagellar assembly
VVVTEPDSPAGQAFSQIAQQIAARVSVTLMQQADAIPMNIIG